MIDKNNDWKSYWEDKGSEYHTPWISTGASLINLKEQDFLKKAYTDYISSKSVPNILDVGIGSGRILELYVSSKPTTKPSTIYGIDYAQEMVTHCKNKFSKEKNLNIKVNNIGDLALPFDVKFGFISAIRVLKYSSNWAQIISYLTDLLDTDGIFVFSMLNKDSLNGLKKYNINIYRTSTVELMDLLKKLGYSDIEMIGISILPDIFYGSNFKILSRLVMFIDSLLIQLFGYKYARILYVIAKK